MSNDRPTVFAGEARYNKERGHWEVELLDEAGQSIGYRALGATRAEAEDRALWLVACRRAEIAEATRPKTFMQRLRAEHNGTLRDR